MTDAKSRGLAMTDAALSARAFSEGCDCRLAGLTPSANPYNSSERPDLYTSFRFGWYHVQNSWGHDAKWPFRALPAVRYSRKETV